jgi:hypothetical protein
VSAVLVILIQMMQNTIAHKGKTFQFMVAVVVAWQNYIQTTWQKNSGGVMNVLVTV